MVICILSSVSIILKKRESWLFYFNCAVAVFVSWHFLAVPWVGMRAKIVAFPGHTRLRFGLDTVREVGYKPKEMEWSRHCPVWHSTDYWCFVWYRTISMRSLWWCLVLSMVSASSCKFSKSGLEVIKLELILRLKIKRNDWLLADTCPQAANNCTLFWVWDYSCFITLRPSLIRKPCWQSVRMLLPSKCLMMLLIMVCLQTECYFIVQHRLVSGTAW